MLPSEGSEILHVAILSGVIGFAGFCISYGFYVWRKRNSANRRFRSRAITLAQLCAFLGAATIAASWAFNEFQGRSGIAGGSDVFVVNARRESFAQQITSAETVTQGEVVAEFLSPADRTRLAAIDLQVSQAEAKKEAIANKVLQSDEALLQEQTHLRSELLQNRGFAFQLQHSRYEVERERATLSTAWTREESKLLEDLAAAERELASALGHREITKRALQRGEELQKQGNISRQQVDMRSSDDLSAELRVEKNRQAIASLKERHAALGRRFESSLASLDRQIGELSADYARMAATIEELDGRIEKVRQKLRADHDRAVVSREREVDAVDYDITILAAEKTRLTEIGQVRVPFAGKVVYRHPAPGLASGNSPILAISAGTGLLQPSDYRVANCTNSRHRPIRSSLRSIALCSINFSRDGLCGLSPYPSSRDASLPISTAIYHPKSLAISVTQPTRCECGCCGGRPCCFSRVSSSAFSSWRRAASPWLLPHAIWCGPRGTFQTRNGHRNKPQG
jgi:prefoldin subunit 5